MAETVAARSADGTGDRREQRGWYFYDWANSVFTTIVITVFLGPYLTGVAQAAADAHGYVYPLGLPVRAGSYFAYVVSASVLLSVLAMPLAGALADRTGRKKPILGAAAYVGSAATCGMIFLGGDRYLLGGALLIVANVAYAVSIVVYHAFLPQIAEPGERDAVSSRGWAFGYAAGALVLVADLALFLGHQALGLSEGTAVRICLASAGLWWAAFTLVPLRRLRERPAAGGTGGASLGGGVRQLAATFREIRRYPLTLMFLLAYLIYNDGVQTVISQAVALRLPGAGAGPDHADRGDPARAGPGGGGRAADGAACQTVRGQTDGAGVAGDLDRPGGGRLLPPGRRAGVVLRTGGGHRAW